MDLGVIEKTCKAYCSFFPELLKYYKEDGDEKIVETILESLIERNRGMIDTVKIKRDIKNILNSF